LPSAILDAEIRRIEELGVKIVCNKRISDISAEIDVFDAVYISIGAHVASNSSVEIKGSTNVFNAIDFLRKLEDDPANPPNLGKRVFVYGGGNTAIDAARTALRLGAKSVKIVYRGALHNMSAHETEISEALAEGIEILCLRSISSVDSDSVRVDLMNHDEESDSLSKSGKTEVLHADSVIFAVGQSADLSLLCGVEKINVSEKGAIEIDKNMMTGAAGVFAGGDVVLGKRSITNAIGHGKKAARCMDAYLRGVEAPSKIKDETANFKKLNPAYYKKNARIEVSRYGEVSFFEKDVSYSDKDIVAEAKRCFSCGNCFHCDNCYGYCPDNAIIKRWDGALEINYDYCKGCGICAAECPCGAIKMVSDEG
jgi:2-oxoacid:acceptor oxidoreductase delta subunit (pyruvate/2-ketoisovalerate family)